MTITTLAVRAPPAVVRLDHVLLRRAFFVVALALVFVAPFSPDPTEFAVGAFVPWLVLRIVGTATLPAAVMFFLLWQWVQIFARAILGLIDNEEMARGVFGPWVVNAYWYMLASVVTLALAFRVVMGSAKPPSPRLAAAHLGWRPLDIFLVYVGAFLVSTAARIISDSVPALDQPLEAVARLKTAAVFLLFASVMSSGKGLRFLAAVVTIELVVGFSGILGDFRGVFFLLFMAAIAARIRWTGMTTAIAVVAALALAVLALFWTSVKADFRELATGSDDSQNIKVSLDVRFGYLANRLARPGEIDWNFASYLLVSRLAYVDIFGSVIGVKLVSPEQGTVRQWSEALGHVFQPRFLFPGKPALSDTEVFIRLARGDSTEQMRSATSISVGYLAENYADFEFPGMLVGVFVIGLVLAGICRFFAATPLPWLIRESIIVAFLYAVGGNGVEVSLPKIFGASFMLFIIYALLAKFAFPAGVRWLEARAAAARRQEMLRQRAKAPHKPFA